MVYLSGDYTVNFTRYYKEDNDVVEVNESEHKKVEVEVTINVNIKKSG